MGTFSEIESLLRTTAEGASTWPIHWDDEPTAAADQSGQILGWIEWTNVGRTDAICSGSDDVCWVREGQLVLRALAPPARGWRPISDAVESVLAGFAIGAVGELTIRDKNLEPARLDSGTTPGTPERFAQDAQIPFSGCHCAPPGPTVDPLPGATWADAILDLGRHLADTAAAQGVTIWAPNVPGEPDVNQAHWIWDLPGRFTSALEIGQAPQESWDSSLRVSILHPIQTGTEGTAAHADALDDALRGATVGPFYVSPPLPQRLGKDGAFWRVDMTAQLQAQSS